MFKVGLRMKDDVEVKDEGLRSGVVQEGGGGETKDEILNAYE